MNAKVSIYGNLQCARNCTRVLNTSSHLNLSSTIIPLSFPFYRWGEGGSSGTGNLLNVTQGVRGASLQTQFCWTTRLCPLLHHVMGFHNNLSSWMWEETSLREENQSVPLRNGFLKELLQQCCSTMAMNPFGGGGLCLKTLSSCLIPTLLSPYCSPGWC